MLTIRSNTCGGGPSMDSKAIVGPVELFAIANELLAALPAQPPSAHVTASRIAATAARGAARQTQNKIADGPLIAPKAISLKCVKV
jgi:hypothetical protein